MTPAERGDLAERLLPIAARLACIVHGDGGPRDIHQAVARLTNDERDALLVVLAGLVDPDARLRDVLDYLTWDENGRPVPVTLPNGTVRTLAAQMKAPQGYGYSADASLENERRLRARRLYLHDGLTVTEVARAIGAAERTVKQWRDAAGWRQAPAITEADARPSRRRKQAAA